MLSTAAKNRLANMFGRLNFLEETRRGSLTQEFKMELSAPTRIAFIVSIVIAVVSLLGYLGVISFFGVHSYLVLGAAFVLLALANLLKGL